MNFATAAENYLLNQKSKVRPSSLRSYRSIPQCHLIPKFGNESLEALAQANNRKLKELVCGLRLRYKPASIQAMCLAFKAVMDFQTDDNGVPVFKCHWNHDFIGAPPVIPAEQRAPMIPVEELNAVVANHRDGLLIAARPAQGCASVKRWP